MGVGWWWRGGFATILSYRKLSCGVDTMLPFVMRLFCLKSAVYVVIYKMVEKSAYLIENTIVFRKKMI